MPARVPGPEDAASRLAESEVRARLVAERGATDARLADLERDLAGVVAASRDVATDDEHDPEGQTIAYERAQLTFLLTNARDRLNWLNRALERLDNGGYDECERCGGPIGAERLVARPTATTCMSCASARP